MAKTPIKETVFTTTPSDDLRVVDAYKGNELMDTAKPEEAKAAAAEEKRESTNFLGDTVAEILRQSGYKKIKSDDTPKSREEEKKEAKAEDEEAEESSYMDMAGKGYDVIKSILLSDNSSSTKLSMMPAYATAADILATGASDMQIANTLGITMPDNVSTYDLMMGLATTPFSDIKKGIKSTAANMVGDQFKSLMTGDLKTYIDKILEFIDIAGLNGLLCPGEETTGYHTWVGFKVAGSMIDIRKYIGCSKGKPVIDFDGITDEYLPAAIRSKMEAGADVGADDVVGDVNSKKRDVNFTPGFKNGTIGTLMGKYESKPNVSKKEYANDGKQLVDVIQSIDSGWGKYNRGNEEATNLNAMSTASPDALQVMEQDPRTEHQAIIVKDAPPKRQTASQMAKEKYPNLQTA